MKKILFLFVISAVASSGILMAQTKYTSTVLTNQIVQPYGIAPMDTWNKKSVVSFGYTQDVNSTPVFYIIDCSDYFNPISGSPVPPPTLASYYVKVTIPNSYSSIIVNDIYIVDDYAFFCGQLTDTDYLRKSVVGYFDINDFFSPNMTINYRVLNGGSSGSLTPEPLSLQQLVAYKNGTSYDVVSYGLASDEHYKIIEINDITIPANICKVAVLPYFSPQNPPLQDRLEIDDILLTDSYVVFTGHDHNIISPLTYSNYPWYLIGSKGSVVQNICDISLNPCYYLPNAQEINGFVIGTSLDDDLFAIAYTHFDNNNFKVRLRVIDPTTNTNVYSQQFKKPEKENPKKMVYLPDKHIVELLVNAWSPSDFFQLQPFATYNYTASFLFPSEGDYSRLRAIDGFHYISSYGNKFYLQDCTAMLPHSTPTCPGNKKVEVEVIPELTPLPASTGFMKNNYCSDYTEIDAVNQVIPKADCFSYE